MVPFRNYLESERIAAALRRHGAYHHTWRNSRDLHLGVVDDPQASPVGCPGICDS